MQRRSQVRPNSAQAKKEHVKQGRMVIVAELYRRGWSIRAIAEEVKARLGGTCSTRTVWNDIRDLLCEWREMRVRDVDACVQLELERVDECVRELWGQWEKSKEDWVRENNKRVGLPSAGEDGNAEIQTVKRENSTQNVVGLGNPAYLAEIRMQLSERRKLLGLYDAAKVEVTGKDGSPLLPQGEEALLREVDRLRAALEL